MPVEKTSDDAIQEVLQNLAKFSQLAENLKDTDVMFLKVLMDSPVIHSLAKVHDTLENHPLASLCDDAREISAQVVHDIEGISNEVIQELCQLLKDPHVKSIIAAHDIIAEQRSTSFQQKYAIKSPVACEAKEWETAVRMIGISRRPGEALGLTVSVNDDDIVVTRILHDSLIHKQGLLHVGDIIREVNGQNVKGNPDLLRKCLSKATNSLTLKIIPSYHAVQASGDVYVKCNYEYNPSSDPYIPSKEAGLPFVQNDVLKIVNRDDLQWWQAQHVNKTGIPVGSAGLIPSLELQERRRILLSHSSVNQRKQSCKMYKLADYYREYTDDFLLYEEVALLPPFVRKCVILVSHDSSIAFHVKANIVSMFSEFYKAPVTHTSCKTTKDSYEVTSKEVILKEIKENKFFEFVEMKGELYGTRYDSVRNVIKSGKCCVKDVSLRNLKFLLTSEFMPYVVFLKPENDITESMAHCINQVIHHNTVEESCAVIHSIIQGLAKEHQWVPVSWVY